MKNSDRCPIVVVLAALAASAAACSHTTGPSLSAQVTSQNLVPTLTLPQIVPVPPATLGSAPPPNPATVCCCRVMGTVQNTSSIPVNINLFFHATTTDGQCPGNAQEIQNGCTGQASVNNVAAGAAASYSASGILKPCALVSSVSLDMTVTGLWLPPSAP